MGEPVSEVIACQHCYSRIVKDLALTGDDQVTREVWRAKDGIRSVLCDPSTRYLEHKPMPLIYRSAA